MLTHTVMIALVVTVLSLTSPSDAAAQADLDWPDCGFDLDVVLDPNYAGSEVIVDMNAGGIPWSAPVDAIVIGTPGDDTIETRARWVCTGDGNDSVHWVAPGDRSGFVYTGTGNDQVFTTTGPIVEDNDARIFLGPGDDQYVNTKMRGGDDTSVFGAAGNDNIVSLIEGFSSAGGGSFSLFGGAGDDRVYSAGHANVRGDDGNDTLISGAGPDGLSGGAGNDSLVGGDGNDSLLGGSGNDILNGGSGDDVLNGEDGFDTCNGGPGVDINDNCERVSLEPGPFVALRNPAAKALTSSS